MTSKARPNVVLIGFMGAGKTSVGKALAARLDMPYLDTDEMVEARAGRSVAEVFRDEGEAGFRRREREAVREAAAKRGWVVSVGGGAVLDSENLEALKASGVLVYLRAPLEALLARVGGDPSRPLLAEKDPRELLEARRRVYEAAADLVVDGEGLEVEAVAAKVVEGLEGLGLLEAGVREVRVELGPSSYSVWVGAGILEEAEGYLPPLPGAEAATVITHPELAELFYPALQGALARAGLRPRLLTFPSGEERKSVAEAEALWREMARTGHHRKDPVVALGGGVVTDLAGFVAATYHRGVPLVNFPTTLLAQVDAAIGGKTGVNLPEGKNLVGAFWQPRAVVSDVRCLASLPEREFRSGLAEVVKAGFVADPGLLGLLRAEAARVLKREEGLMVRVVARAAAAKARVVAMDERESGRRAILNYGHTLAHALEAHASFRGLSHGEAVAIGMVFAAHLAQACGIAGVTLAQRHVEVLEALGLPTSAPLPPLEELYPFLERDKKYQEGLRFVLLARPGEPVVVSGIARPALEEALEATRARL